MSNINLETIFEEHDLEKNCNADNSNNNAANPKNENKNSICESKNNGLNENEVLEKNFNEIQNLIKNDEMQISNVQKTKLGFPKSERINSNQSHINGQQVQADAFHLTTTSNINLSIQDNQLTIKSINNNLPIQKKQHGAIDSHVSFTKADGKNVCDKLNQFIDPQSNISLHSVPSVICRICHSNDRREQLISPCSCKGTHAYVHRACIERWCNRAGRQSCELCKFKFHADVKMRYSLIASLVIWYRNPNHRRLLYIDLLFGCIVAIITCGLIAFCIFSLNYFKFKWSIILFSSLIHAVLIACIINFVLIVKGQLGPWFRWWRSSKEVHLILENYRQQNEAV